MLRETRVRAASSFGSRTTQYGDWRVVSVMIHFMLFFSVEWGVLQPSIGYQALVEAPEKTAGIEDSRVHCRRRSQDLYCATKLAPEFPVVGKSHAFGRSG